MWKWISNHLRSIRSRTSLPLQAILVYCNLSEACPLEPGLIQEAQALSVKLEIIYPKQDMMTAVVGGQPWKLDQAVLDAVATPPASQRVLRPFARHWVKAG